MPIVSAESRAAALAQLSYSAAKPGKKGGVQKWPGLVWLLVSLAAGTAVKGEEAANCTGLVMVPDRNNQKHNFPGLVNETSVEINAVKGDLVTVKGDCCYKLFSHEDGYGQSQHLLSEGQHKLELEHVNSVYKVGCARRGILPVLKFFLVALGIIALLGCIFYCGKQVLLGLFLRSLLSRN
jgi:hypothetical protein